MLCTLLTKACALRALVQVLMSPYGRVLAYSGIATEGGALDFPNPILGYACGDRTHGCPAVLCSAWLRSATGADAALRLVHGQRRLLLLPERTRDSNPRPCCC